MRLMTVGYNDKPSKSKAWYLPRSLKDTSASVYFELNHSFIESLNWCIEYPVENPQLAPE